MSANTMTSAQFYKLLEQNLRKVVKEQDGIAAKKSIIPNVFDTLPSDKAWEEFYTVSGFGDLQPWGGQVSYGNMNPGYWTRITSQVFTLAGQIEKTLILNNQYDVINNIPRELTISRNKTMEKHAHQPFATAFNNTYTFQTSEENLSICNSSHVTKVPGVSTASGFTNTGTSALDKISLQVASLGYYNMRNSLGDITGMEADTIICGRQIRTLAEEAIGDSGRAKSDKDPDSLNLINTEYGRWNIIVLPILDLYTPKNWFVTNLAFLKAHLKWINRHKESGMLPIDETLAPKWYEYGYWGWGYLDWRILYGNNVT